MEQQTTGNRATEQQTDIQSDRHSKGRQSDRQRATDKERQRQSDRQTEPQSARPRD